jgi:zinc protease
VRSDNRLFALRLTFWALDQLITDGLSAEELKRAQGFLEGYTRVFEESLDRRLGYALDDVFHGAETPFLDTARAGFAEATLEQVNAAISAHIQTKDIKVVIVTRDGEALKKQLVDKEAAVIEYPTPKPDEILEQDEEIVSFDPGFEADLIEVVPVEAIFEK